MTDSQPQPARFAELKRPRLFWQIVLLCSAMIFVTIASTWAAADIIAGQYQASLSQRYGIGVGTAHAMFVDALHRSLVFAAGLGVAATILASTVFAPNILRPLRQLAAQAEAVAGGDFTARVDVASISRRCEIYALGAAFNRMAAQLERLDSARRRMIADLAHDLLTPLTNLKGYLEGMRDGVIAEKPSVYAMLEGEIGRLIRLVGDLHQLNLAEGARANLKRARHSLAVLLDESAQVIAPLLAGKGLRLEVEVAADTQSLEADRDHLVRAVRNVLQNAAEHAAEGSAVSVSARREGDWIEIAIANAGASIAAADLPFIFDRFYRADPARSREGGAGLGLAIAKELIEAHDGAVAARSDGGATVIILRLPASAAIS